VGQAPVIAESVTEMKMEHAKLTLRGQDAAIVLTESGEVQLHAPNHAKYELLPEAVLAMAYLAIKLRDPDYCEQLLDETRVFFAPKTVN
jgi:hypothetical protein